MPSKNRDAVAVVLEEWCRNYGFTFDEADGHDRDLVDRMAALLDAKDRETAQSADSLGLAARAVGLREELENQRQEMCRVICMRDDVRSTSHHPSCQRLRNLLTTLSPAAEAVREVVAKSRTVDRLVAMEDFRADTLAGDTLHNVLDQELERDYPALAAKLKEGNT